MVMLGCGGASQEEIDQRWENVTFFYDQRAKQVDVLIKYMEKEEIALDAVVRPLKDKIEDTKNATEENFAEVQGEFSRVLRNAFEILFNIPEYSKNQTIMGFATLIGKTEASIAETVEAYNSVAKKKFNPVLGAQ